MAIGFRSVGTRLKADVSASGSPLSLSLPAGHTTNDLLIMFVLTDANSNVILNPPGWTLLSYGTNGTSSAGPYTPRLQLKVYYRIDDGGLGSSVSLHFNTFPWPTGDASVLAFCVAYTGCDTAGPVESYAFDSTTATTAARTHPQMTTAVANDWLLTYRASSSDPPVASHVNSVGTDVERVDEGALIPEISCALYDSNAALVAGLQTQRTTTANRTVNYGSLMYSIVIKPAAVAGSAFASPTQAEAAGTAFDATVATVNGGWELCTSLPEYGFRVDWGNDGYFQDSSERGDVYAVDAFSRTVSGTWDSLDSGQSWSLAGGSASEFSVASGTGRMAVGSLNSSRFQTIPAPSADVDFQADFATSALATGNNQYISLGARFTDLNNYYLTRIQMSTAQVIHISLRKRVGGAETELAAAVTGLTHAALTFFTVRMRVVGPTLWAKIWAVGSPEPDEWQVSAQDTAITVVGSVGLRSILDAANTNTLPFTFQFDNFSVSPALDGDDITPDIISEVNITYGRDQDRQLSPGSVGNSSFSVNNASRRYSPEYVSSPLFGDLDPARPAEASVVWSGNVYPLFTGRIDDYNMKADRGDRTVDFTFLDGLSLLQGVRLSTAVYSSLRTGDVIDTILDLAGWTAPRDIDSGATVVKFWWAEGTDAFSAIQDIVKSEGPPSIAYVAPDGTFVFRDRHHRLLRGESTSSQGTYSASAVDCTASPAATGYDFTQPFVYSHGWRDIVNSVTFDVAERRVDGSYTAVWTNENSLSLSIGESVEINVSASDPFMNAITPVSGTDYTTSGAGTVSATLDRTSGASVKITLLAIGGSVVVSGLQLRAKSIPVSQTVKVVRVDTGSISAHGERAYPDAAPWANAQDSAAIANMILLHYAQRRPTVQLRVVTSDPGHFVQVLQRTISDRIHITNDEIGLDADFFVERVTHVIERINMVGRPPVHSVILGCEKDLEIDTNPFRFDVRGSGFDQGVFDPIQADDASTVFIFDDPLQGRFDSGLFGT